MAEVAINSTANPGNALQQMLMASDIQPGDDPSYQLCKTIYMYHPLGQKMASAPIAMAQFKPREITVPDGPEERIVRAFHEQWKADKADSIIFNIAQLARIYGIATLAMLTKDEDPGTPVDFKKLAKAELSFVAYDPLNTAGSLVLSQTPNRMNFLKPEEVRVQSEEYNKTRTVVMMNEDPIYLGYTTSAFGYVGRSIYQRPLFPLKSFIQTMYTDDLVSNKAGVLVAKIQQAGSIVDNMMIKLFGLKREFVKAAANYGVISIGPEDAIESLNLQNIDGAASMARKNILENIAVAADMPAKLLNAETFAEGFGEGSEDAKNVARYIDRIRTWMQPLYDFFDAVVMYRAWNEGFYELIQKEYPEEYGAMPYADAFSKWKNSFTAIWPSLLTEPESERAKADDVKLKAIIAMIEVLMPQVDPQNKAKLIQWAADNFNSLKTLFDTPLELDYEALAAYEPPSGEAGLEPGMPKPFSAADSEVGAIGALILTLKPRQRAQIKQLLNGAANRKAA